jgi:hypothetical protein
LARSKIGEPSRNVAHVVVAGAALYLTAAPSKKKLPAREIHGTGRLADRFPAEKSLLFGRILPDRLLNFTDPLLNFALNLLRSVASDRAGDIIQLPLDLLDFSRGNVFLSHGQSPLVKHSSPTRV